MKRLAKKNAEKKCLLAGVKIWSKTPLEDFDNGSFYKEIDDDKLIMRLATPFRDMRDFRGTKFISRTNDKKAKRDEDHIYIIPKLIMNLSSAEALEWDFELRIGDGYTSKWVNTYNIGNIIIYTNGEVKKVSTRLEDRKWINDIVNLIKKIIPKSQLSKNDLIK